MEGEGAGRGRAGDSKNEVDLINRMLEVPIRPSLYNVQQNVAVCRGWLRLLEGNSTVFERRKGGCIDKKTWSL